MTTETRGNHYLPRLRFLTALAGWMRVWLYCIAIALVLTLFGLFPTAISVFALLGLIWAPIVVLALRGRMLDRIMQPRSDIDGGCR